MTQTQITDPASLGATLRTARRSVKLSQEMLSLQTGISRPTIRAIENGKATAHVGLVLQLCRDLGVTLHATLPEQEPPK
jgi:DNA-binding XRE family transcriptional regulator